MKKGISVLLCAALLLASALLPGAGAPPASLAAAAQTEAAQPVPAACQRLTAVIETLRLYLSAFFSLLTSPSAWRGTETIDFPKAAVTAKTLLLTNVPVGGAALTLSTLQGLLANKSPKNLFFRGGAYEKLLPFTGAEVVPAQADGSAWELASLLREFSSFVDGYLLCGDDDESAAVAVSLARQMNSVVVPESLEDTARAAGVRRTMDLRGKTDAWLRRSPYFCSLNRTVAFEQPASMAPRLVDYAVTCGAYFGFSASENTWKHTAKYAFLQNGAVVFGWNNTLGEYKTVSSFSSLNACLVPADYAVNLSVLSGYALSPFKQRTRTDAPAGEPAHTVCLLMSDGDNLQWFLNDYVNASHFGSPLRGNFAFGWGVPAAAADVASPMLRALYAEMNENDEFVLSLSGLGYTFPSRWTDPFALRRMARTLNEKMTAMDTSSLLVLDDGGFYSPALSLLTRESGARGVFYMDYDNYAGMDGAVRFVGDTPVVSARYRLWADVPGGAPEEIAAAVNESPTDPTDPASYSFIIVHAWSGLDPEGKPVPNGDTMAAVNALVNAFDADTRIVTPARFFELLRQTAD